MGEISSIIFYEYKYRFLVVISLPYICSCFVSLWQIPESVGQESF